MEAATEEVARTHNVDAVVLPAPFEPTPEHRNYDTGYIDIPGDQW